MKPMRPIKLTKTASAILLWGGLAVFLAHSPAAHAQNDTAILRSQVELLRANLGSLSRQFQELQKYVFANQRGEAGKLVTPPSPSPSSATAVDVFGQRLAVLESRLDQVEQNKMRRIEGQFDELRNLIERMDARLEKLVADVDYRLTALESTPRAGAASAAQPDPAASAAGAAGAGDGAAQTGGASTLVDTDQGYKPSGAPRILGTIPLEDGVVEPIEPEAQQTASASILPEGTAEERYKYAFGLLRKAQYDEAAKILGAFIEVHHDHPLAENASYWRGETYYARKMFGDAARIYATNLQLYPEGAKAPDNMVKLGMALANLERAKEACQAFAELERKYPEMPANVRQAANRGRNTAGCP
ncbi:MAG: tol-pal system protein YbgF [Alphaproteobacteria bacterium]|jgi:tol-pal system protein YbgF|nr:tol-pal system protein YbgF [Alphaproteobacteria bacterium]